MGKQFSRVIYIRTAGIQFIKAILCWHQVPIGTYRPLIVLEVKYRDLQTCDSPGGEV